MKRNMKIPITSEFATREKMELYQKFFTTLPDPDRILAANGYNYEIYRDLMTDPHLEAAIQQRKIQVLQMGWEVYLVDGKKHKESLVIEDERKGDRAKSFVLKDGKEEDGKKSLVIESHWENLKDEAIRIMQNLDLQKIGSDILDALFFGFSISEIDWILEDGKYIPIDLNAKPQEWFIFDNSNKLKLRKRAGNYYIFEEGEPLPEYKFILTQYQPTYVNPYGKKLLSKCYWPVTFKRDGLEKWHLLAERYGIPYLISYYSDPDKEDDILEMLEKMLEDNIAALPEGTSIDFKEHSKYDVGQLYELLCEFHNKEISKAILTVTLTTDIGKIGSYKASSVHKDMLEFLGVADKKLIERALNTMLRYYTEINYGRDIEPPKVKLIKKENVIEESADRDLKLMKMGVRFTKEYFLKRYNLSEGEFDLVEDNFSKKIE